jgi:hypothetical protein
MYFKGSVFLAEERHEALSLPLYSSDLGLSEFQLFPEMKYALASTSG